MYTVIGHPKSRGFRVMWALEELNLPYEVLPYGPQTAEMRAVNPSGKAPALRIDETLLFDSMAICVHLADQHGALTHPAGTLERAKQDSLMFMILDEIEGPLWTKAKHSFALPEKMRVPDVKAVTEKEYARGLRNLAVHLGDGPYLMGETFTVADILLGHCVRWAAMAGMPAAEDPKLIAVLKAIAARPSLSAAKARTHQVVKSLEGAAS